MNWLQNGVDEIHNNEVKKYQAEEKEIEEFNHQILVLNDIKQSNNSIVLQVLHDVGLQLGEKRTIENMSGIWQKGYTENDSYSDRSRKCSRSRYEIRWLLRIFKEGIFSKKLEKGLSVQLNIDTYYWWIIRANGLDSGHGRAYWEIRYSDFSPRQQVGGVCSFPSGCIPDKDQTKIFPYKIPVVTLESLKKAIIEAVAKQAKGDSYTEESYFLFDPPEQLSLTERPFLA